MASNSNSNSNVNKQVTPTEILQHRATRKAAGMVGCEPPPPTEFKIVFGYGDIWTWRPEDPMNPHCLCFDCRGVWDKDGTIDAQLVNNGHKRACEVYANLLGTTGLSNESSTPETTTLSTNLAQRSMGGGIEAI